MSQLDAEVIETGQSFRERAYVSEVRYDTKTLVVTVTSPTEAKATAVAFTGVVGFRVLDEGDLLDFWPACAANHGWLFRIRKNGWLDQEIARGGFVHDNASGLTEYFIAGQNECISVLAGEAPELEESSNR